MVRGLLVLILSILTLGPGAGWCQSVRGVGTIEEAPPPDLKIGRQHLVVIAVNRYQDWIPLTSPVPDAQEIKEILLSRYQIDEVHELYDEQATKAGIIKLFVDLQHEVAPDDALLVFYAGHGHLDRSSNMGFWIPVNAGTDIFEQRNWLPHSQLKGLIGNVKAQHVLVISDSCFAGDLIYSTRSLPATVDEQYFREAYSRVSRQVLTSGATETVPDDSMFASQLKTILRRNERRVLDTLMLYNEVRLGVNSTAPLLGSLAGTGHQEGASFLLFLKEEASRPGIGSPGGTVRPQEERPSDGGPWGGGALPGGTPPDREVAGPGLEPPAGFFSTGGGLWWFIPVGEAAEVQRGGATNGFGRFEYNRRLERGELAVGVSAGVIDTTPPEDRDPTYAISAVLVAGCLRYSTSSTARLCLTGEIAVGMAINSIYFPGSGGEISDVAITIIKPYLAPMLGLGIRITDHLRVDVCGRFAAIFFDNSCLTGLAPEVSVAYRF